MGESNAPERRWEVQVTTSEPGLKYRRVPVVHAEDYDRVVAERDEAIRAAGDLAGRLWRLPAEQRDLVLGDLPDDYRHPTLAEGEQPAGEALTVSEITRLLMDSIPGVTITPARSAASSLWVRIDEQARLRPAAGVQSTTGQRQDSTADQVESVRLLAQRHGCYDAADWIVRMREVDMERHTYPLEVGVQSTTEGLPGTLQAVIAEAERTGTREVVEWLRRQVESPSTTETARKAGPRDEFERTMTPLGASTTETATGEILVPLDLLSLALLDDGDHVPDDPVYGRLCAEGLCTWNDRDEGWDLTPSGRREITLALGSAAPATPEDER